MTQLAQARDTFLSDADDADSTVVAPPLGNDVLMAERRRREEFRELPPMPSVRRHPLQALAWLMRVSASLAALGVLLALAAANPGVHLLTVGYLLEVQARVARSGKLRSAFYLLPAAGRLGVILLGVTLWLLPIQFLAGVARDSWLLSPGGLVAWLWFAGFVVVSLLMAIHLVLALACGGGVSRFIRPVSNLRTLRIRWQEGGFWSDCHDSILEFVAAVRLPHLLWLGLIGYAATYLWVSLPAYLFTTLDDVTSRWQIARFLVGAGLLTAVLMWLPFLLTHTSTKGGWRSIFEASTVFRLTTRTPFRWAFATALLFGCSVLPLLYAALVKIQIPPHAIQWDLMLVFLVTVAPARIIVGWAYHQATQRQEATRSWPRRLWFCLNGLVLALGVGWYVYFLNLAQTGGELGQRAIWQFHAVLQPLPW